MKSKIIILILALSGILSGCRMEGTGRTAWKTFRPYERIYLDDPLMQLGSFPGRAWEEYVQTIREGATTPGSPVSSGGCGCY